MTETWRDIPGWEGCYQVSDQGRVLSLARVVPRGKYTQTVPERMLKPDVSLGGYLTVRLQQGKRYAVRPIHRLVLVSFVGPPPAGTEGCHGDGNRTNNTLANLRWDTRSANVRDSIEHGTNFASRKTHCKRGHEFTSDNTRIRPGRPTTGTPRRECRTCYREYQRIWSAGKRAALRGAAA